MKQRNKKTGQLRSKVDRHIRNKWTFNFLQKLDNNGKNERKKERSKIVEKKSKKNNKFSSL